MYTVFRHIWWQMMKSFCMWLLIIPATGCIRIVQTCSYYSHMYIRASYVYRLYYARATKFPGFHLPLPGHRDKQSIPGTIPENPGRLATMSADAFYLPTHPVCTLPAAGLHDILVLCIFPRSIVNTGTVMSMSVTLQECVIAPRTHACGMHGMRQRAR